jgi:hypothetical protein
MTITDMDVLDAFDSIGDVSIPSSLLEARLLDEGFNLPDIVENLFNLVNRGLFVVNITGFIQRASLN